MNLIVNSSKVSHNVTHDVVLSTDISYHKCDIVLAQGIEPYVIYFCMKILKAGYGKINW